MRTVYDLTNEEFEELKERHIIEFELDDISDEEIREYYNDTYFVEEDFFCNTSLYKRLRDE